MKTVKLCSSKVTRSVMRCTGSGLVAAVLAASAGCATDGVEDAKEAKTTQAISPLDITDASGTVTVRIKQCADTGAVHFPTATCSVDSGFVLVGGGAEIVGDDSPGALLYASFPDTTLTTWTAQSKDHDISFLHQLRAYSIGLRLTGVAPATLRASMALVTARSAAAQHPFATAGLPAGFKVVGGGARANWISAGQLLIGSFPSGQGWFGASKDHVVAETGTIDVFAIGITTGTIPGFGTLDVMVTPTAVASGSGYSAANLAVPSGWVLTSIGGNATFNSAGRMLTDMVPYVDSAKTQQGATIRSKDHEVADIGQTSAVVISARRH